jgi:DNA-directed RNA polymerase specialized sigma24 family protein
MRHGHLDQVNPQDRKATSCRCGASDPEDAELKALFHDLALTLYQLMDPADADILTRAEIQGQTPAQIADQIGCSQVEAARRLAHAQRCFCQLAAQSIAPANSR